ncbi:unnamed protein product [Calypogeia fissa]
MSSVLVSSQCQCSVVAVPNLSPIPPSTSSSSPPTLTDGHVLQPLRSGYGLSRRSTLQPQSRALQFERLDGKFNAYSSSCSPNYGRSPIFWRGHFRPQAGSRGKFRVVSGAVDGSSYGDSVKCSHGSDVQHVQRRALVRLISSSVFLPGLINSGSVFGAAAAAEDEEQSPESSPTIEPPPTIEQPPTVEPPKAKTLTERLLERSKANKAKYDQERLDAYYRRNFKDYFEFLKGSILNKDQEKLTETEKGILSWLEKNP